MIDRPGDGAELAWMRRAVVLAERGWGRVAPNPLVGAVVVRDGEAVGEGFHAEYGRPHAEIEALRAAGDRARGASLFVTLEPCSHHGKTPPCTDAILAAGVRRVVYAVADPNPAARGGAERLRQAGVEVRGGVGERLAADQNAPFLFRFTAAGQSRPWIALKLALSLDASIADARGRSAWITGEEARAEVHRLRAGHDAIAVGINTALADDPKLTLRGGVEPRKPPARVVFDHLLRLPTTSYLARTARESPVLVLCGPQPAEARLAALERLGVRVLPAADLAAALGRLRAEGIGSVLCEGGAGLGGALLREGWVDRLCLFYAPLFLGAGGRHAFAELPDVEIGDATRWRRVDTRVFGPDTLITLARE